MQSYNLERLNFLIVDDNRHMHQLLKELLRAFNVRHIRSAEDGATAMRELMTFPADIVICDWYMQPLDGLEFVRLVRTGRQSPDPFVPVIMLTGHTERHRVEAARDAGVNEFLVKPLSAKALYAHIVSIIENPRAFVEIANFKGPDRRRKRVDPSNERRAAPPPAKDDR